MKLKKWIAAAVAVLALASLVSGCGSDKKAAAPAEKKTITVGITPGYSEQIMEVVKKGSRQTGADGGNQDLQ